MIALQDNPRGSRRRCSTTHPGTPFPTPRGCPAPSLRLGSDGYYRSAWSAGGRRRQRCFGRDPTRAAIAFADWLERGEPWVEPVTVQVAWDGFERHAADRYRRPDGSPTGHADNLAAAFAPLLDRWGSRLLVTVGARELRQVQQAWIAAGLHPRTVNQRIGWVRGVFRWFVQRDWYAVEAWQALRAVLPAGGGNTRSDRVRPAAAADVAAAAVLAGMPIRAMIEVQRLTAMRPGELVGMRPVDVQRAGRGVWVYRPVRAKVAGRVVYLGPRARAVLERVGDLRQLQAPVWRNRRGGAFTTRTYRQAIRRACVAAGVSPWSPNQLRHVAATLIRARFGLDAAQAVLGHATVTTTQVYAEQATRRAVRVAELAG